MEIQVENLEYTYGAGTSMARTALKNVQFRVPTGKILGVLGGTGSGKTTLIKNLNGLLFPTRGTVLVGGRTTLSWGPELRRRVGVVFQRPERQLFAETVYADVSFVLHRFSNFSQAEIRQRVEWACEVSGLDLQRIERQNPRNLSDGEKRKAALAGVLVNEPEVLILDEPAVGLDPPSIADLVRTIEAYVATGPRSVVIVSHDMEPFFPLLDLLLVLHEGRRRDFGQPCEVCARLIADRDLRGFVPGIAVAVLRLRADGYPIPCDDFRVSTLAELLGEILTGNPTENGLKMERHD
jgi:energy-coupling factor transport system ATP-binding protein